MNAGFDSGETYLPSYDVGPRTCELFEKSCIVFSFMKLASVALRNYIFVPSN